MTGDYIEYDSNNSGGYWWLSDEDWRALEAAGWEVKWCKHEQHGRSGDKAGRWLGALACSAIRRGLTLREAIEEWERVTGHDPAALGCGCCGVPHNFAEYRNGQWTNSWSPSAPVSGARDW